MFEPFFRELEHFFDPVVFSYSVVCHEDDHRYRW